MQKPPLLIIGILPLLRQGASKEFSLKNPNKKCETP